MHGRSKTEKFQEASLVGTRVLFSA